MHWTSFLAYRRFPAHARVMEDCACIQCGYNLRMQMVSSRCPECGHEVGNSVFLLAKPTVAARGLRTAALSYFALVAAPLALWLIAAPGGGYLVASLVAVTASMFRLAGMMDLRFNAALVRIPVIGGRLNAWWLACIIDLLLAVGWLVALLVLSSNSTLRNSASGAMLLVGSTIAWWLSSLVSVAVAGRFGFALMDMLNFVWTRIEFRAQQLIVGCVILLIPVFWIVARSMSSPTAKSVMMMAIAVGTALAWIATCLPLLHSATACEETTPSWDELIDTERIAVVPESQHPRKPEPPPIRLEDA